MNHFGDTGYFVTISHIGLHQYPQHFSQCIWFNDFTRIHHWLVILTILKNMSSSILSGWHPIHYGKHKIHVWNHQPDHLHFFCPKKTHRFFTAPATAPLRSSPATLPRTTTAEPSSSSPSTPALSGAACRGAPRFCCHGDGRGHRVDLDIRYFMASNIHWIGLRENLQENHWKMMIPSGNSWQFAIENGHRNSEFSH